MRLGLKILAIAAVWATGACSTASEVKPEIVPAVMKKENTYVLGTIGEVEHVYLMPMESPFEARIDTGAKGTSIGATNIKAFERDGEKWVSFSMKNKVSGETKNFEKPLAGEITVKRINVDEKRYLVNMDIKIGQHIINADISLADREYYQYQVLIGRNILKGRALVDTALSHTVY
jgi:hypothetical protein